MKIFPTAQVLWALSLSLLVCLFLSTAICFLSCFFFKYLFIFSLLMLLKFGLWLFIQLSLRTFASAWWCPCGCFILAVTVHLSGLGIVCGHSDQFPLGRAHPLQVVFRWWFMLLTGSFWSPLVTCKDVAGRPSVSRGRARCLIFSSPPTPLAPRRYMYNVKCERNNIMWKKTRLHRSWHFLQWLGIWKKISHGGSLNLRVSLLLPERATSATGVGSSLCSSSTCHSLRAESTSTSCPECEDVHSSAGLFAIVAERMQRSTVGLHREQHLGLRSVT